jgi:hypothetical protein
MRVWIPPEDIDPTVLQELGRKGISVFGEISLSDDRLITRITEGYNAFTLMEFLSVVHKKFPDSVFVPLTLYPEPTRRSEKPNTLSRRTGDVGKEIREIKRTR